MNNGKALLMSSVLGIGMLAVAGCDQDESCDDNWNGKVRTSFAAGARSASNENNGPKLLYILAGEGSKTHYLGSDREFAVRISYSWGEGYASSTHNFKVNTSVICPVEYECSLDEWEVINPSVSSSVVSFVYKGELTCNDTINHYTTTYKIYDRVDDFKVTVIEK